METYLGNSNGVLIGPYGDNEMGAVLHGKAVLGRLGGGGEEGLGVYVIKARNLSDAQAKLKRQIRKEAK